MSELKTKISTDTWIEVSWDEYIEIIEHPEYQKAKSYYDRGKLRLEMTPLGNDHSKDHSIINHAIHLFASIKDININGHDNCTYRKIGIREAQPDLSFYIGENADAIPWGTTIVSLDEYPAPNLVVEIANTSFADDLGSKRILYEDLKVQEYWIVDVNNLKITAFAIENVGSRRITDSQVLPGLAISLLEEALRRTRQMNHGKVGAWLLSQFQQVNNI
jgi:Uma2 family endonuclease